MPILTELAVSIAGGVATAILGALVGSPDGEPGARGSGGGLGRLFADLLHLLLAVAGGIAIALLLGRYAIQSGIMVKGFGGRLVLLVGGTALCWFLFLPLRRR